MMRAREMKYGIQIYFKFVRNLENVERLGGGLIKKWTRALTKNRGK